MKSPITRLKRQRATIERRQESLDRALVEREELIREGLRAGMSGLEIARLTGVTPTRISQIKKKLR